MLKSGLPIVRASADLLDDPAEAREPLGGDAMSKAMRILVVSVVAGALVVAGGAAYGIYAWTNHTKIAARSAEASDPTVKVESDLTGLLPGSSKLITVSIQNINDFSVTVASITGGSLETRSGCPAWAVRVSPMAKEEANFRIPARTTRKLNVGIEMESWADQKCAGQTFVLDLVTSIVAP
jgi:hypothetical protein